ncbi:MAG: DUF3014 domain-containing protein [Gammaproteobacteria bacterium]|jgi:hypothetical protein|nr:DUF3014 domain-containing protein [Gammaproteobacteria bacterium]
MNDEGAPRRPSKLFFVAVVVLVIAAAWLYFRDPAPVPQAPPPSPPAPEAEREPLVRHPVPEAPAVAESAAEEEVSPLAEHLVEELPDLEESDSAIERVARYLVSNPELAELLVTTDAIRRLVSTVDSLTGESLPLAHLPAKVPAGRFLVLERGDRQVIDERNFARYEPHVALLGSLDGTELAQAYAHFYPLFQEAWRDLGKGGYFNDRLIEVIDHLLEGPEALSPLLLEQPSVAYVYADPALEAQSSGRKLLLRMGPENAAAVKARLRDLRATLVR